MLSFLHKIPWPVLLMVCATLGLAPFFPEPHIWQKLNMLMQGTLSRPIDILDFLFHGTPWVLLVLKLVTLFTTKEKTPDNSEK